MRAIVVERWSILRSGLRTVLANGGHAVLRVVPDTASAVLAVAAEHQPDLVLLGAVDDVEQPEAVRRFLAAVPELKVVVLAAHPGRALVDALLTAGVAGVLDHTTEGPALLEALDRVRRGERVLSDAVIDVLVGIGGTGAGVGAPERPVVASLPGGSGELTAREAEIVRLLGTGASNRDIAGRLFIGEATVKTHLASAYGKLGVVNRHQAVVRAVELGLVRPGADPTEPLKSEGDRPIGLLDG